VKNFGNPVRGLCGDLHAACTKFEAYQELLLSPDGLRLLADLKMVQKRHEEEGEPSMGRSFAGGADTLLARAPTRRFRL